MGFQYAKAKSAAKRIDVKGPALETLVLKTMKTISSIVGATLGPGGQPVLIERQEFNLPAMITKDGVTVMRSLGFEDAVQHSILEAARDAAVRTASEAGDGTTTATVLAEAIVRLLSAYCKANPKVSPQKVVRRLESCFTQTIEPLIKSLSIPANLETPEGRQLLHSVATVSANGDTALADAVMECFDIVGDNGNVTITESAGNSRYEVEEIDGFPVAIGLDDSCMRYANEFINDPGSQRCFMQKVVFIIYHGKIDTYQSLTPILMKVGQAYMTPGETFKHTNVVVVATGFSDTVLASLAMNFKDTLTLNVFPLVAPRTAEPNSQLAFLQDVAAITGATILDPIGVTLEQAQFLHMGPGVEAFEAQRWRSNIIRGDALVDEKGDLLEEYRVREDNLLNRIGEVETQLKAAPSQFTAILIQERLAKLTGGIARLKVIGASNGELKEKRDRAEDAVCGVRGAIKFGCLPGGCWALLRAAHEVRTTINEPMLNEVLVPALETPLTKILENAGIHHHEEQAAILEPVVRSVTVPVPSADGLTQYIKPVVYDAMEGKHVDAISGNILDSVPAVLEAIRNSISIASLLGTLGGTVVFKRDSELERYEAKQTADYLREGDEVNPADERG
jgi:chaperonin GroEL